MLELDEEDYESLGYGNQKAYEVLAVDMAYARSAYNTYMREYMREWRKQNPALSKEINKRYRQTEKGKANARRSYAKYIKSAKGKANQAIRSKEYLAKIKKDPVKYRLLLDKLNTQAKARRAKRNAERNGSK